MRWTVVPFLALLVSCGPSAAELAEAEERGRQEERERAQLAQRQERAERDYEECLDRNSTRRQEHERAIREARNTVLATLENLNLGSSNTAYQFSVNVENLSSDEWEWVEEENHAATDGTTGAALLDRITYEVDPRALSSTIAIVTYQGFPAINLQCSYGDCIRARGRRVAFLNAEQGFEDIDERRSGNSWPLGTSGRAQVVRGALTTLINGYRNPPQDEQCNAPGGAGETNGGKMADGEVM